MQCHRLSIPLLDIPLTKTLHKLYSGQEDGDLMALLPSDEEPEYIHLANHTLTITSSQRLKQKKTGRKCFRALYGQEEEQPILLILTPYKHELTGEWLDSRYKALDLEKQSLISQLPDQNALRRRYAWITQCDASLEKLEDTWFLRNVEVVRRQIQYLEEPHYEGSPYRAEDREELRELLELQFRALDDFLQEPQTQKWLRLPTGAVQSPPPPPPTTIQRQRLEAQEKQMVDVQNIQRNLARNLMEMKALMGRHVQQDDWDLEGEAEHAAAQRRLRAILEAPPVSFEKKDHEVYGNPVRFP